MKIELILGTKEYSKKKECNITMMTLYSINRFYNSVLRLLSLKTLFHYNVIFTYLIKIF